MGDKPNRQLPITRNGWLQRGLLILIVLLVAACGPKNRADKKPREHNNGRTGQNL